MSLSMIRLVFVTAGIYDFLLGLVFLIAGPWLFDATGVPPPNHWAYIQFIALLLIIFGIMFFAVAYNPTANHNLILYGMLLKLSYCGVVAYYSATSGCPTLFKPFAVIDAFMFVLFVMAYQKRVAPASPPVP